MSRFLRVAHGQTEDTPLDPMVDVVFQLLVFFIFSFQIRLYEGVVTTEMVDQSPATKKQMDIETVTLRLASDESGAIQKVSIGEQTFSSLDQLDAYLRSGISNLDPAQKIVVHPDSALKYQWLVEALLRVQQTGRVVSVGVSKITNG